MLGQQIDRAIRPSVPPPAPFKFPAIRAHSLANGVRLLVVEDHSVPVVAVRVVVGGDSTWDPSGKEGLFAVTLGALREGSVKRSADDLARAAATIGTNVAPTGFTTTSSAFEPALDIMAEMLTEPAFDSAGIERRKALQSAAARRVAQAPVTIPRRLFYALTYGATDPFVRSLLPSETTIASIGRADVASSTIDSSARARRCRRRRRHCRFSCGPRRHPRFRGVAIARRVAPTPGDAPPAGRHEDLPARRAGPQAYLFVGELGPSRDAPDAVAAEAFGVVAAARLQQTLREKRSFMYSGTTGFTWRHGFAGTFVGSTTVSAQKADSALREWLGMLRGLRIDQPVTNDELEMARRNRVGTLPSRIDGPDSFVTRLVELTRDGLPPDYFEQFARRMSSVTTADVTAAANHYIDLDHLVVVVTGDRTVLEPALRGGQDRPGGASSTRWGSPSHRESGTVSFYRSRVLELHWNDHDRQARRSLSSRRRGRCPRITSSGIGEWRSISISCAPFA